MKTIKQISMAVIAILLAVQISQAQELDYKSHRIEEA